MTFSAFLARNDGTDDFSFEGRDERAGILGTFAPCGDSPVITAPTLEDLERDARTFLGNKPEELLYLTDCDCRVFRIVINKEYHEAVAQAHAAVAQATKRATISLAILAFSVTALLGATIGSIGIWPLLFFVGAVILYSLLLTLGLFNEIEGAILCEIMLILAMAAVNRLTDEPTKAATINLRPAERLTHEVYSNTWIHKVSATPRPAQRGSIECVTL